MEYNKKLRIFYILKIFTDETDASHPITLMYLMKRLQEYGWNIERKMLYDDIDALREIGYNIVGRKQKQYYYYLEKNTFTLSELKLLADAVASAKFLPQAKSESLIERLTHFASIYERDEITRTIYVSDRSTLVNEKIMLNLDLIQRAIRLNKKITFHYFDYNIEKEKVPRGGIRIISPYAMVWNRDCYYLVCKYSKYPDSLSNFRVDRMYDITVTEEECDALERNLNLNEYLHQSFSMFSGVSEKVTLRMDESLVNSVLDHFGPNVTLRRLDGGKFSFEALVKAEPPFFCWLMQFGDKAELTGPTEIQKKYLRYVQKQLEHIVKTNMEL